MPVKRRTKKQAKLQNTFVLFDPVKDTKRGINTTLSLMISALTLVAALSWNEAVKTVFSYLNQFFPKGTGDLAQIFAQFLYAILVTLLVVVVINRLENIKSTIDSEDKSTKSNKSVVKGKKKKVKK